MRTGYSLLFLIAIFSSIAGAPPPQSDDCQGGSVPSPCVPDADDADAVVGVSEIITPYSSNVASYSATELGTDVQAYYDAYVEGYLYQGSTLVAEGAMDGGMIADGYLNTSYQVANTTYQILSYHYLVAAYCENEGVTCYSPMSFTQNGGGSGWAQYSGTDAEEGNLYLPDPYVYLGSTYWSVNTALPQINAVYNAGTTTPASVTVGTQNAALEIHGQHLTAGGDDPNPTVSISGAGVTWWVNSANDSQINVGYNVGTNATLGLQSIVVTTYAGVSDPNMSCQNSAICLNIGDPTPVISSIVTNQPNNAFQAGSATSFTVYGTGFGTNPILMIGGVQCPGSGGSGIVIDYCAITPGTPTDNGTTASFSATVTVDASAPSGTVAVRVTSQGYANGSGYGFMPVAGSSSTSNQQQVQVLRKAPIAWPPYIVLGTGAGACAFSSISAKSVQVGQQIAFTACLPTGLSLSDVTSMSWTPTTPLGTAVGGYTTINSGGTSSGTVVPLSSPSCTTAQSYCSFPAFYWLDQGTDRKFTFTYTLCCGGGSNSAAVTFDVTGPTGISVTTPPSLPGVNVLYPPYPGQNMLNYPLLIFGASGVAGITFHATAANLASGSYVWVQLVQHNQTTNLDSLGQHGPTDDIPGLPEVDDAYPYGYRQDGSSTGAVYKTTVANDTAMDSPWVYLIPNNGEWKRYFQATMYLMWVPSADPQCGNGTACTIPVPQVQVQWSFIGDVINTLQPGSNPGVPYVVWVRNPNNCSGGSALPSQQSTSYPQWTAAINPL